jgi:hypothetical protein
MWHFPETWQPGWGDELRHIKGRVENERAAKGTKSGGVYDVKLGPGCLSDIESARSGWRLNTARASRGCKRQIRCPRSSGAGGTVAFRR